jgi:sodium transport system permease protein
MKFVSIFWKEMVDILRDRRTLFSGLAYVLIGPIAVAFMINLVAASSRDDAVAAVKLCGKGEAPSLIAHLTASGITFTPDAKVCLDIPADYGERLAQGRGARLIVSTDLIANAQTARKLETELKAFASNLASQRLMARGVSPGVTTPFNVEMQNLSAVSRQADMIGRILIIFFVCAPFFVCLAAAADMTAGERERRSLETLLAEPIGAFEIVFGKWLAVGLLGVVGTTLCIALGLFALSFAALPELGVRLETGAQAIATASILLLPLCFLVAAAQLAIALYAKSFKDAQSYLTLFSFTPLVAGFVATSDRMGHAGFMPISWELKALAQPLLNAAPSGLPFTTMALIEAGATLVILIFAAARLRSEEILKVG